MATITTKAGLVEDKLVEQLQVRIGLAGVQVEVGPLGNDQAFGEWIMFGAGESGALSGAQEWGAIGNRRRDESVTVNGRVYVNKPGAGAYVIREARDRAMELMAEVEEQLRDDPKIDGLVVQSALVDWRESRYADPTGRQSVIDFTIQYMAWLPRT